MPDGPLSQDLAASLAARKELGADYEPELVQSFLNRVDREVDLRVAARLGGSSTPAAPPAKRGPRHGGTAVALGTVTLGIPVTAIVATQMHGPYGLAGMLVAWGGIALVNVSHAFGHNNRS